MTLLGDSLPPRIDHRKPLIAFAFLVLVAVAVIGSAAARAVDGVVLATGPTSTRVHISKQEAVVVPPGGVADQVREPGGQTSRTADRAAIPTRPRSTREAKPAPAPRQHARAGRHRSERDAVAGVLRHPGFAKVVAELARHRSAQAGPRRASSHRPARTVAPGGWSHPAGQGRQ